MKKILSIIVAVIILISAIPLNLIILAEGNTAIVNANKASGKVMVGTYVALSVSEADNDIWYTVDGSDPTNSKTAYLYDKYELLITKDITVKAVAKSDKTGFGAVSEFKYTCMNSYIYDDQLWKDINVSYNVSLDTKDKKVGKNSIKFAGGGGGRISTGEIKIACTYDYKLSFWAKTENMPTKESLDFRVFLTTSGGGGDESHPTISGLKGATLGNYGESFFDFEQTQDWKYYEVDIKDMSGTSHINIIVFNKNGGGTFWIDGVTLTAMQKENYPITVLSNSSIDRNVYTQSTSENFVIEHDFIIYNKAKTTEKGTLYYDVYSDINPQKPIQSGKLDISVASKGRTPQKLKFDSIKEYGTYTVKFTMVNSHGANYDADSVHLSRIIDNTHLVKNGGTYLGTCGAISDDKGGRINNIVGNSMLRLDYTWNSVETQKGVYKVDETLDNYINMMVKYNIEPLVIFNVGDWPLWMEKKGWPETASDEEHFLGYIRFLVETYKGKVKYFEFFNEINGRAFRSNLFPDAEGYTETMKKVYTVLKEANPDAKLLGGGMEGFGTAWARIMFQNGAADYMDYYSFHPYCQETSPESADWIGEFNNLNNAIKAEIGREFPLFVTETGMAVSPTTVRGHTTYSQMTYLTRLCTMAKSFTNLEKIITYQFGSTNSLYSTEMQYGMFSGDGTARPLAAARAAFNYMHNGFTFDSVVSNLAKGVYCYKFAGKNEDMYVLWTNDVECDVTISTSASAKVYDIFGNLKTSGKDINTNIGSAITYVRLGKGQTITNVAIKDEKPTENKGNVTQTTTSSKNSSKNSSKTSSKDKSSANKDISSKKSSKTSSVADGHSKSEDITNSEIGNIEVNDENLQESQTVVEENSGKDKSSSKGKSYNYIMIIAIVLSVLAVGVIVAVVWCLIKFKNPKS